MSKTASGLSRSQLGKVEVVDGVEKWEAEGKRIWQTVNRSAWEMGDWWNAGEPYGDRVERARAIGFDHGSCRIAGHVAGRFEVLRRRNTISWGHHREVSKFAPTDQETWLDKAEANEWSVMELRSRVRALPRADTPALPDGTFSTIVADPPWDYPEGWPGFGDELSSGYDRRPLAYQAMSLDEVRELEVIDLAAPDAHLFLWTTNRYIRDAFDIAEAWGFDFSQLLAWCKPPRGIGPGGVFSNTSEFICYGRRGTPDHKQRVDSTWWPWPRRKHSEKPVEFLDLIESVCPGPYLEMFARSRREGWTAWGLEAAT